MYNLRLAWALKVLWFGLWWFVLVCGVLWCGLWCFVVVCGVLWCLVPPREQNRTEQNRTKLLFFYISQATIWHMRLITYILTFYFKVQVWLNIISMVTMLSVVLILGTSNMGYIFSYMLLFVEK